MSLSFYRKKQQQEIGFGFVVLLVFDLMHLIYAEWLDFIKKMMVATKMSLNHSEKENLAVIVKTGSEQFENHHFKHFLVSTNLKWKRLGINCGLKKEQLCSQASSCCWHCLHLH